MTHSLVDFYNAYARRDSDLINIIKRLDSLLDIFQHLEKTLLDRDFYANEQGLIKSIKTSI